MQQIQDSNDDEVSVVGLTLIYVIWEQRNKAVHTNIQASLEVIVKRLDALMCDYGRTALSSNNAAMAKTKWRRPAARIIKLNFHASWTVAAGAGLGMIVRNSNGEVTAVAAHGSIGAPSPHVAEAMAFRW